MSIKIELQDFLNRELADTQYYHRNVELISYFFGFGDAVWPTLEETGAAFGVGTRERTRQIINKYFYKKVTKADIPSVRTFAALLCQQDKWLQSELVSAGKEAGLIEDNVSIRGILNLMKGLKVASGYEFYTPTLDKASRTTLTQFEEIFIINKNKISSLRKKLKIAVGIPGEIGVAKLAYIKDQLGDDYSFIKELIKNSPTSWVKENANDFWYLFENKENVLINYSEKVFSEITKCHSSRLATAFRNALDGRTRKNPYPPQTVIEEYLLTSIYFKNNNRELSFLNETTQLTKIEHEIAQFFAEVGETDFPTIRNFLEEKGYILPTISKNVGNSPLVFVDKTKGRSHYKYSFINNDSLQKIKKDDRYEIYFDKLRKLQTTGTDTSIEQQARKEQGILQDWLFGKKASECCAICGKKYNTKALVTAHKKKRKDCNDAERLDPHIVFPLCVFGCDYLYENDYIRIHNGAVLQGKNESKLFSEKKLLQEVVGNSLSEKWFRGNLSYFERN